MSYLSFQHFFSGKLQMGMIRKAEKEKKHDAKKHVKYRKKDWYVAGFCFATIIGKAFKILTNWSHFKIPCLQKQFPTKVRSLLEHSCAILISFKIGVIFNLTSADFVWMSADVVLKMTAIPFNFANCQEILI